MTIFSIFIFGWILCGALSVYLLSKIFIRDFKILTRGDFIFFIIVGLIGGILALIVSMIFYILDLPSVSKFLDKPLIKSKEENNDR